MAGPAAGYLVPYPTVECWQMPNVAHACLAIIMVRATETFPNRQGGGIAHAGERPRVRTLCVLTQGPEQAAAWRAFRV